MSDQPTCTHCGDRARGSASVMLDGVHHPLCHADDGLACFRLVTVYRHPLRDCPCPGSVLVDPNKGGRRGNLS